MAPIASGLVWPVRLASLVPLLTLNPLAAQGRLLIDLNRTPAGTLSSNPASPRSAGNTVWFTAETLSLGRELWHIDSAGQTTLATTLGGGTPGRQLACRAALGDGAVVTLDTSVIHSTIYCRAQMPHVDLLPNPMPGVGRVAVAGSKIFLVVNDGVHGFELWISRGAAHDARLVVDLRPGGEDAAITAMAAMGDNLLFAADDGSHGLEWWSSDGTAQGTHMLADHNPGPAPGVGSGGGPIAAPVVVQGPGTQRLAFFAANDGRTGLEPCVSDGTPNSIRSLGNLQPDFLSSAPSAFAALPLAGRTSLGVVFSARGPLGEELYVSDGTAAGTRLLLDLQPGADSSVPRELTATPRGVIGHASIAGFGVELFFTDGTVAGTHVIDTSPGPSGAAFAELTVAGTQVYCHRETSATGRSLIVTDGTVAGTHDLGRPAEPGSLAAWNGTGLFFASRSDTTGIEPWLTDGTRAGTRLARDIDPTPATRSANPHLLGQIGGRMLFRADDGQGYALWATDGSAARVQRLRTLQTVGGALRLSRRLLVEGDRELIITDGTVSGTIAVPIDLMPAGIGLGALLDADRAVFGVRLHNSNAGTLWVSDGTATGTHQIAAVQPSQMVGSRGVAYFTASSLTDNPEVDVWRTDGTAAGTRPWIDLSPADSVDLLGVVGDRLIVAVNDLVFATDGTAAGTRALVQEARNQTRPSAAKLGDLLVFARGRQVLATDGITATPLLSAPEYAECVAAGDRVLIHRQIGYRTELWRTDGTVAGTESVPYPFPAATHSAGPLTLNQIGWAVAGQPDDRLLVSDGTASGTRIVADLRRFEGEVLAVGNQVLFANDHPQAGRELFVASLGAIAQREGHGCGERPLGFNLTCTDPHLGQTLIIRTDSGLAVTSLLLGRPSATPVALPGVFCPLWIELAAPTLTLPMRGVGPLPLPMDFALIDVAIMLQAISGPSRAGVGFDVSNGVRLTLGI